MTDLIVSSVRPFKVRPVNHGSSKRDKNRYCGPAVLSIMSGITTAQASRLIRHLYPYLHAVRGTSSGQIKKAFGELGINMFSVAYRPAASGKRNPTLAGWLKQTVDERTPGRVFLLVAGHHWQIVTGRRDICGIVKELGSIKDKRVKRRARVTEVYELEPQHSDGKVRVPSHLLEAPKSRKSNNAYSRVQKLIKKYPNLELGYELDRLGYGSETQKWVECDSDWEKFIWHCYKNKDHPAYEAACVHGLGDGRCCYDWDEVEDVMTNIIEFASKWYAHKVEWCENQ